MPPPKKFKSRNRFFAQEYSQSETSFDLSIPGILLLAYGKSHRDWILIPIADRSVSCAKTVMISQDDVTHKWYACLTYQVVEKARISGPRLYPDPGCKTSLIGIKTTGEFFEYDFNPLRKLNLSTYQLIDDLVSQKDKMKNHNSPRWRRLNKRIKKLFGKIHTRTKTYLHTLANQILIDHLDVETFKVGDWDKRKTLAATSSKIANRRINRAVQNNNPLGTRIEILTYKARLRGQEVEKLDLEFEAMMSLQRGVPPAVVTPDLRAITVPITAAAVVTPFAVVAVVAPVPVTVVVQIAACASVALQGPMATFVVGGVGFVGFTVDCVTSRHN